MNREALEQRVEQYARAERELDDRLMREADASSISDDLVAAAVNGGASLNRAMDKLPGTDQVRTLISSINQCRSDRMDALQKLTGLEGSIHGEQAALREKEREQLLKQCEPHLAKLRELQGVDYEPVKHVQKTTEHHGRRYHALVGAPLAKSERLAAEAQQLRNQASEVERAPVLGSGSIRIELENFASDPMDAWEEIAAELYRDEMTLNPCGYEIRQRLNGDELRKKFRQSGSTGNTEGPWHLIIKWSESVIREVALLPVASVSMRSPAPLSPHQAALG